MLLRRSLLAMAVTFPAARALAQNGPNAAPLRALSEGGVVALIRHARAPGTGDPPGFRLGDCATQRNMSNDGRRQAAEMGQRLRRASVPVTEVRSSRWCRALETARLAFPEIPVEPEAALDSFFGAQESAARQSEQTRSLIAGWRDRQGVLALVTHQVNVTALTQVFPAEGEIVVLRPNLSGFELVGRVPP